MFAISGSYWNELLLLIPFVLFSLLNEEFPQIGFFTFDWLDSFKLSSIMTSESTMSEILLSSYWLIDFNQGFFS